MPNPRDVAYPCRRLAHLVVVFALAFRGSDGYRPLARALYGIMYEVVLNGRVASMWDGWISTLGPRALRAYWPLLWVPCFALSEDLLEEASEPVFVPDPLETPPGGDSAPPGPWGEGSFLRMRASFDYASPKRQRNAWCRRGTK